MNEVIVTTCDLKEDYEIIGPVFYQISNKGLFSSSRVALGHTQSHIPASRALLDRQQVLGRGLIIQSNHIYLWK